MTNYRITGQVRYLHPRPRNAKQWARDIEVSRRDAAVALDAVLSGDRKAASALGLSWLLRLAIEDYRLHAPGDKPSRIRAPWVFRHFKNRDRVDTGRGDVFCLFCCEPLLREMRERGRIFDKPRIDYGPRVAGHTTPCALSHLAGQRKFATWGAVKWPDDMLAEAP